MTTASDEFWLSYHRNDEAEFYKERAVQQKIKTHAEIMIKTTTFEQENLKQALLTCSPDTRAWVSPVINHASAYQLLYSILQICRANHEGDEEKAFEEFRSKLELDKSIKERIINTFQVIEEHCGDICSTYQDTLNRASESITPEKIVDAVQKLKTRTWKDIPQRELMERLGKGEVLPRDEWVPGMSEGGRVLNSEQLKTHLNFGLMLKKEGNVAFQQRDFQLALTRYAQGVNLLNWVEGETEDEKEAIQKLLLTFLKNQAAAAIEAQEYRIALKASEEANKIDEYDEKALYRHAQAAISLGELTKAKRDLIALMKSPYCTTEGHTAAYRLLQEMRKIVNKWKTNTKNLINVATTQDTFSDNRPYSHNNIDYSNEIKEESGMFYQPENNKYERIPLVHKIDPSRIDTLLNEDEVFEILERILEVYTRKETQKLIAQLHREADYDERRVLIRAKKHLPLLLESVFDEYNLKGETFLEKKRVLDSSVQYWRHHNDEIKLLTENVYKAFLGDSIDD